MNGLYGRKYKLTITCNPSVENKSNIEELVFEQKGTEDSDGLRIVFDINYPGISGWYYSEITIYNVNDYYYNKVLNEGSLITLEAGYRDNCDIIFQGFLFQVIYERENVVDKKMVLMCMDGDRLFTSGMMLEETVQRGMKITSQINKILSDNAKRLPMGEKAKEDINNYLNESSVKDLIRGETIFKTPSELFKEKFGYRGIGKKNTLRICGYNTKIEVIDDGKEYEYDKSKAIVISPSQGGLVGTPRQTMYGCNFTCLLNPKIVLVRPHCVVKLEGTGFQQMRARHGEAPIPLSGLGVADNYQIQMYQIIGVRHIGDSRGDQWYTYATGINLKGAIPVSPITYTDFFKE